MTVEVAGELSERSPKPTARTRKRLNQRIAKPEPEPREKNTTFAMLLSEVYRTTHEKIASDYCVNGVRQITMAQHHTP
jgi:hypothetical protein